MRACEGVILESALWHFKKLNIDHACNHAQIALLSFSFDTHQRQADKWSTFYGYLLFKHLNVERWSLR